MNTFMIILAVILGVVGIIGSIVPGIPGPPLSWIGILLMYFFGGDPMSLTLLFVLLAVTIVVTVLDYVVPAWFTRWPELSWPRSSLPARGPAPRSSPRSAPSWASSSARGSSSSPPR